MAYSDPNTVHNPATGTSPPAAWGDLVRDDIVWLAGDAASGNPKPMCRVYHNTTQSIATSTATQVVFNSERFDVGGMHSTSTNTGRITVPTGAAGVYLVIVSLKWANASSVGLRSVSIRLNGGLIATHESLGTINDSAMTVSALYAAAAGDYFDVSVFQTSGGLLSVASVGNQSPEFSAIWQGVG